MENETIETFEKSQGLDPRKESKYDSFSLSEIADLVINTCKKNELLEEEIYVMSEYLRHAPGAKSIKYQSIELDPEVAIPLEKRVEIVERELDTLRSLRSKERTIHEFKLHRLKSQLEEFSVEKKTVLKDEEDFKKNVYASTSTRTGRVMSEKVEKYLDNSLKVRDNEILKLKQRLKKITYTINKLKKRLKKNTVMNEKLSKIDFDQLKIENEQMRKTEKTLNDEIIRLKSQTGKTQQILTSLMDKLTNYTSSQKKLTGLIKDKEERMNEIEERIQKEEKLKEYHEARNRYLVKHHEELRVPEILDYVKVKSDLNLLRKEVVSWRRKVFIAENNKALRITNLKKQKNVNRKAFMKKTRGVKRSKRRKTEPRSRVSRKRVSLDTRLDYNRAMKGK